MMLGRIFEGRLGQFIAPDEKIEQMEAEGKDPDDSNWSIMQFIAPDPNYYNSVQEKDTSTTAEPSSPSYKTPSPKAKYSKTPQTLEVKTPDDTGEDADGYETEISGIIPDDKLQNHVLSAARATAFALKSPTFLWEERKNFFTLCSSVRPLKEKNIKKMKKLLQKNPNLATSFSTDMKTLVPDGFTPLHAAASAGNMEAAIVLLDFEIPDANVEPKMKKVVSLQTTDLQGRQPLHIASQHGHTKLVSLLRNRLKEELNGVDPIGSQAPLDLSGRTPLGWACASREKNAQKNRRDIEKTLFSPGDASICGPFSPALQRNSVRKSRLSEYSRHKTPPTKDNDDEDIIGEVVEFGYAEMAGWRVEMEDALCCHYPVLLGYSDKNDDGDDEAKDESRNVEEIGLFGVFDGHGDGGQVSRFIADNLLSTLQKEWTQYKNEEEKDEEGTGEEEEDEDEEKELSMTKDEAVLVNTSCELDEMLYKKNNHIEGGSTGVFAILKKHELIVANIGDSRAIMVSFVGDLEDESQSPTNTNNSGDESNEHTNVKAKANPIKVIPLTEDHKPNLPSEQDRIEHAGMKVVSEKSDDTTFHKVQLASNPNTKIAISRAFGDFEFKSNTDLAIEEQALICVPEITTYKRNKGDKFLILACDGIWDVMSNEEVGNFVYKKWVEGERVLAKVGDELLNECLTRGSRDNMTVLIVRVSYDEVSEKLSFQ